MTEILNTTTVIVQEVYNRGQWFLITQQSTGTYGSVDIVAFYIEDVIEQPVS